MQALTLLRRIERLGVEGSEIVDQIGKGALKLDIIDIHAPLDGAEAKCNIRAILTDVWQKRWD